MLNTIAAEITNPANVIAQISTLYFVFWASVLDSSLTIALADAVFFIIL